MTTLDILFWLLIALLGGVAWGIEAGLVTRHRQLLLASTLPTFGAVVFIMFWIEDKSEMLLAERPKSIRVNNGEEEERGYFEFEKTNPDAGKKKKKQLGDKDENVRPDHTAQEEEDNDPVEYTRQPFRDCRHCPFVVIVPAGTVDVGSKADDPARDKSERVIHFETISRPFAVGRLEILRDEYAAFVAETQHSGPADCDVQPKRNGKFNWQKPGFEQDGRHPVVCVSTRDVEEYLRWLSQKSGRTYRLLTEIEWEYAARAGTKTPYWQGNTITTNLANFNRSRDGTIPGGSVAGNAFGIGDVSGNVWEMIGDCDNTSPNGNAANAAKQPPATAGASDTSVCERRLLKGGGWNSSATQVRLASRAAIPLGFSSNTIGFRVARAIDERDDDKILSKAEKAAIAQANKAAAEIEAKERAEAEKAEKERIEAEEKERVAEAEKAAKEAKAAAEAAKAAKAAKK